MLFFIFFVLEIVCLFFLSQVLTKSLSRVFLVITKSQTITIHILSFLFLPGVIIHELSHLFMAGILFVRTGEIEFMPQIIKPQDGGGVKLGSVEIGKTDPIRRAIIGFAPVFIGLSIILDIVYFQLTFSSFWGSRQSRETPESVFGRFWTSSPRWSFGEAGQNDGLSQWIKISVNIAAFYLLFAISNTMFSSKIDMEGTIELLAVIAIIFTAFYVMGFRPHVSIPNTLVDKIVDLIKQLDLFLLLPLAIDFTIVGIIKVFNRR